MESLEIARGKLRQALQAFIRPDRIVLYDRDGHPISSESDGWEEKSAVLEDLIIELVPLMSEGSADLDEFKSALRGALSRIDGKRGLKVSYTLKPASVIITVSKGNVTFQVDLVKMAALAGLLSFLSSAGMIEALRESLFKSGEKPLPKQKSPRRLKKELAKELLHYIQYYGKNGPPEGLQQMRTSFYELVERGALTKWDERVIRHKLEYWERHLENLTKRLRRRAEIP